MKTQDYSKIKTALRYWLLGKNYHIALASMEYGLKHHTGVRKDGKMPEYQHQISQANYVRTLEPSLLYPEETISTILLHDIVEDCPVTLSNVRVMLESACATQKSIDMILSSVEKMTNRYVSHPDQPKKPSKLYYESMIECPIASIAKGCDRIHNHQTMPGVFTYEKQQTYINETQEFILPMIKSARKKWTKQEAAYQNIKHVLLTQIELIQTIIQDNKQ